MLLDLRLMGHSDVLCDDVRKVNEKSAGNGYDCDVTEGYKLLVSAAPKTLYG